MEEKWVHIPPDSFQLFPFCRHLKGLIMNWIDIKKQLPNDDNNKGDSYNCVLVFSKFNGSIAFAQYNHDYWILLSDGIYSDVGEIGIELKDISHWMPLPDLPQE